MAERLRFSADPLPAGGRVACRVEYNGSDYHGWQAQPHLNVTTVQSAVESALGTVADRPLRVHCAGRTDTGVHGYCQIIHFDAPVSRSPKSWVMGANANLPRDIRLHWALPVAEGFHARFSATARRYRYVIANGNVRPALLGGQVAWQRHPLDAGLMHEESQRLRGEQDFSCFRAAACQSSSPMRDVQDVSVFRCGEFVVLDIQANAFLHHMVRNIAGSLMLVGARLRPPGWFTELLFQGDRKLAADTAEAAGLYLVDVQYPETYSLPATPYGPQILAALAPP